jgi:hypothetical protein
MSLPELEALVDPNGRCANPRQICAVAALFGLTPALPSQIAAGRRLAAQLISDDLASVDLLAAVQRITSASLFVHTEGKDVTGVLGFFPVRAPGLALLDAGGFDARHFDLGIVARPGETPKGVYAFGVAASTKAGGSAIIRGSAAIQEALLWALPIYTRVATEDGARVLLGSLGFAHVDNDETLVRRPPRARPLEGFYAAGLAA